MLFTYHGTDGNTKPYMEALQSMLFTYRGENDNTKPYMEAL